MCRKIYKDDRIWMTRWLVLLIALSALTVLGIVFGFYWSYFKDLPISTKPSDWGTFGDFVGGTANPLLSFFTIVLLAFTIILQSRQLSISSKELRLSRKELALTRDELKRSANAQELSGQALRAQTEAADITAKLTTVNSLMEYYSREIEKRSPNTLPSTHKINIELQEFKQRSYVLQQFLDKLYVDFIRAENGQ